MKTKGQVFISLDVTYYPEGVTFIPHFRINNKGAKRITHVAPSHSFLGFTIWSCLRSPD